jgi:hypothetical protein
VNHPDLPLIDALDLVALLLAVYHTVARLDVAKRAAADFPGVAAGDFSRWQRDELAALKTVLVACFGYIVADLGFKTLLLGWVWAASPRLAQGVGLGLFLPAAALFALGAARRRRARRLRLELGIDLR